MHLPGEAFSWQAVLVAQLSVRTGLLSPVPVCLSPDQVHSCLCTEISAFFMLTCCCCSFASSEEFGSRLQSVGAASRVSLKFFLSQLCFVLSSFAVWAMGWHSYTSQSTDQNHPLNHTSQCWADHAAGNLPWAAHRHCPWGQERGCQPLGAGYVPQLTATARTAAWHPFIPVEDTVYTEPMPTFWDGRTPRRAGLHLHGW